MLTKAEMGTYNVQAQLDMALPEVVHFTPKERPARERRGYFRELHRLNTYRDLAVALYVWKGLPSDGHYWRWEYLQDNFSWSYAGTLRGMHYQKKNPQGKLITVLEGEIYDVAVDVRRDSKTFGHYSGFYISAAECNQVYIPPGFAHGFFVTSRVAGVLYKCTQYYEPGHEISIRWDDPSININWPIPLGGEPLVSQRDKNGSFLANIHPSSLPEIPCD